MKNKNKSKLIKKAAKWIWVEYDFFSLQQEVDSFQHFHFCPCIYLSHREAMWERPNFPFFWKFLFELKYVTYHKINWWEFVVVTHLHNYYTICSFLLLFFWYRNILKYMYQKYEYIRHCIDNRSQNEKKYLICII